MNAQASVLAPPVPAAPAVERPAFAAPAAAPARPARAVRQSILDYIALTKPRLTGMAVFTALAAFLMAWEGPVPIVRVANLFIGTLLAGMGAGALNMVIERDADARMERTRRRPLPAGRLTPNEVLTFGVLTAAGGVLYLTAQVNLLTGAVAALTLGTYLAGYTPLKRVSSLNTVVGAVSGALPPIMGWTAARNGVDAGGWALFAIVFLWQLPHFLAIAWRYRADYARAGFAMLPVLEPDGVSTARQATLQCFALLIVSLWPAGLGLAGRTYLFGALGLGLAFLAAAAAFGLKRTETSARRLFLASVVYLPLLLAIGVLDKALLRR